MGDKEAGSESPRKIVQDMEMDRQDIHLVDS